MFKSNDGNAFWVENVRGGTWNTVFERWWYLCNYITPFKLLCLELVLCLFGFLKIPFSPDRGVLKIPYPIKIVFHSPVSELIILNIVSKIIPCHWHFISVQQKTEFLNKSIFDQSFWNRSPTYHHFHSAQAVDDKYEVVLRIRMWPEGPDWLVGGGGICTDKSWPICYMMYSDRD